MGEFAVSDAGMKRRSMEPLGFHGSGLTQTKETRHLDARGGRVRVGETTSKAGPQHKHSHKEVVFDMTTSDANNVLVPPKSSHDVSQLGPRHVA